VNSALFQLLDECGRPRLRFFASGIFIRDPASESGVQCRRDHEDFGVRYLGGRQSVESNDEHVYVVTSVATLREFCRVHAAFLSQWMTSRALGHRQPGGYSGTAIAEARRARCIGSQTSWSEHGRSTDRAQVVGQDVAEVAE
jgi:hypothetical protein